MVSTSEMGVTQGKVLIFHVSTYFTQGIITLCLKSDIVKLCINVLSLSTVVLNSRDRQGMYGMQHFRVPINKPHNSL